MARNGSGIYSLTAGQPVVAGTVISDSVFNALTSDIATALTQSLSADGQTPVSGNINLNGFILNYNDKNNSVLPVATAACRATYTRN